MRLFSTVHNVDYSWHTVSAAQWQKYPNPDCPHVQHVDVLDSRVDPETGVLRIERLLSVNQKAPALVLRVSIIAIAESYIIFHTYSFCLGYWFLCHTICS
jgi:hypothetical protein